MEERYGIKNVRKHKYDLTEVTKNVVKNSIYTACNALAFVAGVLIGNIPVIAIAAVVGVNKGSKLIDSISELVGLKKANKEIEQGGMSR